VAFSPSIFVMSTIEFGTVISHIYYQFCQNDIIDEACVYCLHQCNCYFYLPEQHFVCVVDFCRFLKISLYTTLVTLLYRNNNNNKTDFLDYICIFLYCILLLQ